MQRIKYNESEILDSFFEIAGKDGLLEKKAELLYPDFDISAVKPHEIEGLTAIAAKNTQLYGVTGEDGDALLGEAHPGGGTTTALDNNMPKDKQLAKVETLPERAKIMREIAEGTATGKLASMIKKLVSLANDLDKAGLSAFANDIDLAIKQAAGDVEGRMAGIRDQIEQLTQNDSPENRAKVAELHKEYESLAASLETGQSVEPQKPDQSMVPEAGSSIGAGPGGLVSQENPQALEERHQQAQSDKALKAQKIKQLNTQVQEMLDAILKAQGKSGLPGAGTGVMTEIQRKALDEIAGPFGKTYRNWSELFSILKNKLRATQSQQQAPAQPVS